MGDDLGSDVESSVLLELEQKPQCTWVRLFSQRAPDAPASLTKSLLCFWFFRKSLPINPRDHFPRHFVAVLWTFICVEFFESRIWKHNVLPWSSKAKRTEQKHGITSQKTQVWGKKKKGKVWLLAYLLSNNLRNHLSALRLIFLAMITVKKIPALKTVFVWKQ